MSVSTNSKPILFTNCVIMEIILLLHLSALLQEANSASYMIGNKPYARSVKGKYSKLKLFYPILAGNIENVVKYREQATLLLINHFSNWT